jgi:hypothetical protein
MERDRYLDGFLDFELVMPKVAAPLPLLIERAKSMGVALRERAKFCGLDERSDRVKESRWRTARSCQPMQW